MTDSKREAIRRKIVEKFQYELEINKDALGPHCFFDIRAKVMYSILEMQKDNLPLCKPLIDACQTAMENIDPRANAEKIADQFDNKLNEELEDIPDEKFRM